LNFVSFIYVYRDNVRIPEKKAKIDEKEMNCPFQGKVIADKDVNVLGFTWPSQTTLFTINHNWEVFLKGSLFGWIDIKGQIRKGIKGNSQETLSSGEIIAKIIGRGFCVDNVKVGELV
jgi:hypothetical protein